jgi:hypothetical protein
MTAHISKQSGTFFLLFVGIFVKSFAQCSINFGSLGTGSIVQNGGTETKSISYDIWNETTGSCSSSGGNADLTIDFEIIETFDVYGGKAFHTTNGTNYQIEYSASGFKGTLPHGNIATTRSSPGDVRCYKITVNFAPHVNNIIASDFKVNLNSVNTAGTAFESTALAFLDRNNAPYGSFNYSGYYQINPGNTHPGIVTACPNMPPTPNVSSTPWTLTGPGVYTASNNTVNISNSCNPTTGTSSSFDNDDVLASDTGLSGSDGIGGFIIQVCLENVGTFTSDSLLSAVSTSFTSTLNGFTISGNALPVSFMHFNLQKQKSVVGLAFSTSSEKNNALFTIERSFDAINFESIGEIKGAGNSTEVKYYTFTDFEPHHGVNYYRLRQQDFNGKFSYSEIKSIKFGGIPEAFCVYVVNKSINICSENLDMEYQVFNIYGSLICQTKDKIINCPTSGTYIVRNIETGMAKKVFVE